MTETQTLNTNWTECYAVPGAGHIIDAINPLTGLTFINASTEAEILEREPQAVRMTWEDWSTGRSLQQRTPIRWEPTTGEQYEDMLCCLPPAAWSGDGFLVGEPDDHDVLTGRPRFRAYRRTLAGCVVSSRPLTIAEFRKEIA